MKMLAAAFLAVLLTVPAFAESRSVLVRVTHDKQGSTNITIRSDDKADRRVDASLADACKAIGSMKGWGSIVHVYVVSDAPIVRSARKAISDAIDANPMLDLAQLGGAAPKHVAEHFSKDEIAWRLTATAPERVTAGEPIFISLQLKNSSEAPLVYGEVTAAGHEHVRGVTIVDRNGNEVPQTRFGKQWSTNPENYDRYVSRSVKPGEAASFKLNLSLYFDLTVPGTYTVTVRHRFAYMPGEAVGGRWSSIEAAPVQVEIVEPKRIVP